MEKPPPYNPVQPPLPYPTGGYSQPGPPPSPYLQGGHQPPAQNSNNDPSNSTTVVMAQPAAAPTVIMAGGWGQPPPTRTGVCSACQVGQLGTHFGVWAILAAICLFGCCPFNYLFCYVLRGKKCSSCGHVFGPEI